MKILAPTLCRGAPSVGHGEFFRWCRSVCGVCRLNECHMSSFGGVGHGTVSSNVV
jgi:hypothetical protein